MARTWNPNMTDKQVSDHAYWERNMSVLYMANYANKSWRALLELLEASGDTETLNKELAKGYPAGWYIDFRPEMRGWSRVISIHEGKFTIHVPDDFTMGSLPQIDPNWDKHTTEEKWERVARYCGILA